METTDERPLLREEDRFPGPEVLRQALGGAYPVFAEFMEAAQGEAHGLAAEWRYYRDGKAWLCKATHRKKTVAWISVWDGYFKVGFYFTERSGAAVGELGIAPSLLADFAAAAPVGRLRPLAVAVRQRSQLADLYALIAAKKKAG